VPWPALAGYGAGYGLGDWFEKLREKFGLKEDLTLFAAIVVVAGAAFLVMTWSRERRAARQATS
jgi:membrane protein DedA with SNARE-associated domain